MCPILFQVGPITLRSYGVALLIAFAVGILWARARSTRFGVGPNVILDSAFPMIIAGVIGARVVYIAQEWSYYSTHRAELLSLQFNGLTSFGGFLFGILALWGWATWKKQPIKPLLDCYAAPLLVANAIGRVGCFLNGCCFGVSTSSAVGVQFPGLTGHHHPAQLYETGLDLAFVAVMLAYERRNLRWGQPAGFALVLFGLGRFVYEFWRAGTVAEVAQGIASSTRMAGLPITEAHVVAFAIMIVGAIMVGMGRRSETYVAVAR